MLPVKHLDKGPQKINRIDKNTAGVSDQVRNPEDRFSHNEAHFPSIKIDGLPLFGKTCSSLAWVPVWSFFFNFFIFCFWSKMSISTEINNGLPIPLMCYLK